MSGDVLGAEWHLTTAGVNIITENGTIKDRAQILKRALDTDLKEIGGSVLSNELNKDKTSKLVLQIQKIRNISAPKANEESQAAPRMLKLILTDGETCVQALELSTIQQISRDRTAPGTKVLINGAEIVSGYLLLNASCFSLLGGKVPYLYEKWELAKSVQHNNRQSGNSDGPPPWVNFGCKIQIGGKDENFKSLETKNKDNKEDTEFEQQRQGAIAEATSGAIKKVFGGRVKQQVQPAQINNNFKRNNENRGKNFKGKTLGPRDVDDVPQKPSEKVSLFDFLETKLPVSDVAPKVTEKPASQFQNYQQNSKPNYQRNKGYETRNDNYRSYPPKSNNNRSQQYNNYNNTYNNQGDFNRKENYPVFPKPNETRKEQVYPKLSNQRNDYQNSSPKFDMVQNSYAGPRRETYQQNNPNFKFPEKTVNDITNNMSRVSISNNSFASKIIRQQLNIGTPNRRNVESSRENVDQNDEILAVGSECLAKYWEDGKFYNAIITAITERTYVVKFRGYDNIEEILKKDCQPVGSKSNKKFDTSKSYAGGSMEFHRGRRVNSKN